MRNHCIGAPASTLRDPLPSQEDRALTARLKACGKLLGIPLVDSIIIGDGKLTMDFSRELFKEGVLGTGITYPTVPEGKARVRTIMTATHTSQELQQALEVLGTVGKRMGILS